MDNEKRVLFEQWRIISRITSDYIEVIWSTSHLENFNGVLFLIKMDNEKRILSRCSIDSGTCYQINRMSTQTWHVVG